MNLVADFYCWARQTPQARYFATQLLKALTWLARCPKINVD